MFSSIVPIQTALSKNLNDSLDLQRSKTKSTMVKILDTSTHSNTNTVIFGIIAVAYGMSIYYFLPLSLLSMNFTLILKIFFAILVGMLVGLSLLAYNLQRFLEIFFTHVFLFFEKKSMKKMVISNLATHNVRNKMTSIIYSISIGCAIYLIMSLHLEIRS